MQAGEGRMLIPFALPSPIYFFSGSGFSGSTLHAASLVMAERACEGRRGSPRYQELVSFTQWKYQKRIKQDVGYKVTRGRLYRLPPLLPAPSCARPRADPAGVCQRPGRLQATCPSSPTQVWALYNDAVTLYVSYWKACYFCAAVSRALEALASPS